MGRLNAEFVTILEALAQDLEPSRPLLDYIIKEREGAALLNVIYSEKVDPMELEYYLAKPFTNFAQAHPDEAQTLIASVVIPNHPFHSEILAEYDPSLLSSRYQGFLVALFTSTVNEIAKKKLAQIFPTSSLEGAEGEFRDFLKKYGESFHFKLVKSACTALSSIPLETIHQHFDSEWMLANPMLAIIDIAEKAVEQIAK